MTLAAGQRLTTAAALLGLKRLPGSAETLTQHHPRPGSVRFPCLCTTSAVLGRRTPGDLAVSADADLGTRDQLLHVKPRGSLLPLWYD